MRWTGQRTAHPSLPIEAFEPGGRPANMLIRGTRRNAPRRRTAIVANRDGFGAWGRGAEFPERAGLDGRATLQLSITLAARNCLICARAVSTKRLEKRNASATSAGLGTCSPSA